MSKFELSKRASDDLLEIADYTIEPFDLDQSFRYRDDLKACFAMLAEQPSLG